VTITVALRVPFMGPRAAERGVDELWLGAFVAYLAALTLALVITREEMAATWRALGLSRRAARTP
jgi:hypothetical protein